MNEAGEVTGRGRSVRVGGSVENANLVRNLLRDLDERGLRYALDRHTTPDLVVHLPGSLASEPLDRGQYEAAGEGFLVAFPDLSHTVEDIVADGDRVWARLTDRGTHQGDFMGVAPTGREVQMGVIAVYRIRDGKVAEVWEEGDILGLFQQLGMELVPAPTGAEIVEEAKAVIASHEDYAGAGDLAGVMTNVHPDVLVLTAGAPLIRGAAAFREFYAGLLSAGAWDFTHDYHGSGVVGDVVELFGVASGSMTPHGGTAAPFANNFHLQLRRDESGRLKVWRASFAPTLATEDG